MSQVAIIAKLRAAPGYRDELIEALQVGVTNAEREPGTIQFIIHEDANDFDVVWSYELYADQESLDAHGGSDAFKALGRSLAPLLGGRPELTFLKSIGGKGLPVTR